MFWNNFWAVFGAMLPIFAACFVMLATATVICMSPRDRRRFVARSMRQGDRAVMWAYRNWRKAPGPVSSLLIILDTRLDPRQHHWSAEATDELCIPCLRAQLTKHGRVTSRHYRHERKEEIYDWKEDGL